MKTKAETPTSLAGRIATALAAFEGAFNLDAIYRAFPEVKQSTIRGRIYDTLMERGEVERLGKGLYRFRSADVFLKLKKIQEIQNAVDIAGEV